MSYEMFFGSIVLACMAVEFVCLLAFIWFAGRIVGEWFA